MSSGDNVRQQSGRRGGGLTPTSRAKRSWSFSVVVALMAGLVVALGVAAPAQADTVYELEGTWAPGTPDTVGTGDAINARWWFNLNDDAAAPGNEPVDDVTLTVTADGAIFDTIPPICLTEDVDPVSSISDDGLTLVCNVGTQDEGSAIVLTAAMTVTAASGEPVSTSASIADQSVELPPLAVENDFLMDIRWVENFRNATFNDDSRDVLFNWTLFHGLGSPAGPDSVTYTLTVGNTLDASVGSGSLGCSPFTVGGAPGHPWSGADTTPERTGPFVGDCTLTHLGGDQFALTLSGIDYSQTQIPTLDSAGAPLPSDRVAVASGTVQIRVFSTAATGQVNLTSSAPTYEAVDGNEFTDDASNNSSQTTWISGNWNHGWTPGYTGSGVGQWTDSYRVSPGTEVRSTVHVSLGNSSPGDLAFRSGVCTILDTRYVTYTGADFQDSRTGLGNPDLPGTFEYYTGTAATLNPDSPNYDPNSFEGCDLSAGWTTVEPADASTVRAVRVVFDPQDFPAATARLRVTQTIHDDVDAGQDIWTWGAYINPAGSGANWFYPRRSMNLADMPEAGSPTPGARYPFGAGGRDALRIVTVEPSVEKSVSPTVVDPNGTATYTLTYSADGTGAVAETVDGYELSDTLPQGASYVAGSASPEPAISTDDGRQVLTWTLDDVPTNAPQELTYQVAFDADLEGGDRLVNTVTAGFGDVVSSPDTAAVTVNDAGLTQVIKTADQAFIPNIDGDGVGDGSWTVQVISLDPLPQAFTDTIDILPHLGDERGTDFAADGSYVLSGPVEAPDGATVYYTTDDPATLSDDPADASNGAAGDVDGNTVGWTTEFSEDATAVRVITGELAPFDRHEFRVFITTEAMVGEDTLVNRAQGRAENTRLVMRTSAPTQIANFYSANLKKYVQDVNGDWRDANDELDYPQFFVGDTVRYRIVIENTGQGTLTDLEITDDLQPELGNFLVESLAPGETESHEFEIVLEDPVADQIVNTACADAAIPEDSQIEPTINCDPAGIDVVAPPFHEKSLLAAAPIGDGQWQIDYRIVVENEGTPSTSYSLVDELRYADQIDVVSAEVTSSPEGVELYAPAWDGVDELRIATNVEMPRTDDPDYEPHVYEMRVIAEVPLWLDGAGDGDADPTVCGADGDGTPRAFTNTSQLTDPAGNTEDDWACAEVPSIDIEKTAVDLTRGSDGRWTVDYEITVRNAGGADGVYTLSDRLRFGAGIDVRSATVHEAPSGVSTQAAWTGLGEAGSQDNVVAEDVDLASGASHTYQVRVIASVDDDASDSSTFQCPDPGSGEAGGFSNVAGVAHNDLTETDDACPTPGSWLPQTGAEIAGAALLLALLLIGSGWLTLAVRRRRVDVGAAPV